MRRGPSVQKGRAMTAFSKKTSRRLTGIYFDFFKKAEETRRWNVFKDIPWNKINKNASEDLALCAETFCCVELYLPDYAGKGLQLLRAEFSQAWFQANWAYEESKHSLGLMEYLVRSGKRTEEQMEDLRQEIFSRQWQVPFDSPQRMTIYGMIQELATFMFYRRHKEFAEKENDPALSALYHIISKDEMAHHKFYKDVIKVLLDEDRPGVLRDISHVFKHFKMPAEDLVPGYDERVLKMRDSKVGFGTFLTETWVPILKDLDISRRDLRAAQKDEMQASGANA